MTWGKNFSFQIDKNMFKVYLKAQKLFLLAFLIVYQLYNVSLPHIDSIIEPHDSTNSNKTDTEVFRQILLSTLDYVSFDSKSGELEKWIGKLIRSPASVHDVETMTASVSASKRRLFVQVLTIVYMRVANELPVCLTTVKTGELHLRSLQPNSSLIFAKLTCALIRNVLDSLQTDLMTFRSLAQSQDDSHEFHFVRWTKIKT